MEKLYFNSNDFTKFLSYENYIVLILLLIGSILGFLFLAPIVFKDSIDNIKLSKFKSVIFQVDFYKLPLRWLGYVFLLFYSVFSKKGKCYFNQAINGQYTDESFDDKLMIYIGKEISYSYSLYIINTINYFQSTRHWKNQRKNGDLTYFGFFGTLKMLADAYKLDPSSKRFICFEQRRFDFDNWIPSKKMPFFIQNEPSQLENHQNILEQKEIDALSYQFNEGFDSLNIATRNIDNSSKKRFD